VSEMSKLNIIILSAGLGALNWLLLALWPVFVAIVNLVPVRQGEELLHEKFGKRYDEYVPHKGKLMPQLWGYKKRGLVQAALTN
jgi:protein-S-isoprenylcysteine O-methyltransferase Ste14